MSDESLCTEDMIIELLVHLSDIANDFQRRPYSHWQSLYVDEHLVVPLATLSIAQSMLKIEQKMCEIAKHLEPVK